MVKTQIFKTYSVVQAIYPTTLQKMLSLSSSLSSSLSFEGLSISLPSFRSFDPEHPIFGLNRISAEMDDLANLICGLIHKPKWIREMFQIWRMKNGPFRNGMIPRLSQKFWFVETVLKQVGDKFVSDHLAKSYRMGMTSVHCTYSSSDAEKLRVSAESFANAELLHFMMDLQSQSPSENTVTMLQNAVESYIALEKGEHKQILRAKAAQAEEEAKSESQKAAHAASDAASDAARDAAMYD